MSNKNEIRKHYYLDDVTIIAPKRGTRPSSFTETITANSTTTCVLCLNDEHPLFSINSDDTWQVKAVSNPFGTLSPHQKSAFGYQEVIIESPSHITKFSELGVSAIANVLSVYINRIQANKKHSAIKYVSVFKNSGAHAGATQPHSHSQLYALPFKPPYIDTEIQTLQKYKKLHHRCALCDVIATEIADKERVILQLPNAIAIAPYASAHPYEVWILPTEHISSFARISKSTKHDFAQLLWGVASFLDTRTLDFNYYIHDLHHVVGHSFIKITPRLGAPKIEGGLELATGLNVNSVAPEDAANEMQHFMKALFPAYRYTTAK